MKSARFFSSKKCSSLSINSKRDFLYVGEFYLDRSSLSKIKLTRGLRLLCELQQRVLNCRGNPESVSPWDELVTQFRAWHTVINLTVVDRFCSLARSRRISGADMTIYPLAVNHTLVSNENEDSSGPDHVVNKRFPHNINPRSRDYFAKRSSHSCRHFNPFNHFIISSSQMKSK